jgi:hypothetical protein
VVRDLISETRNEKQKSVVVAQLVLAPRYKPLRRGYHFRSYHCNFLLTQSFRPHYVPRVDSSSNRNEYQVYLLLGKGGRCVGLTSLTPSCADCLKIWEPQLPVTLRACNWIVLPLSLPVDFTVDLIQNGEMEGLTKLVSVQILFLISLIASVGPLAPLTTGYYH